MKLWISLLGLAASGLLCGQSSLSLSALEDSMRQNNRDLQALVLEIEASKTRHQSGAGFGALGINYSYGQLDGLIDNDFQIQTSLSLGNPVAAWTQRELKDRAAQQAQLSLAVQEAFLGSELRQNYARWRAFRAILGWRQKQKKSLEQALSAGQLQLEGGAITRVELSTLRALYLQSLSGSQAAQQGALEAQNALEQICRCSLEYAQPEGRLLLEAARPSSTEAPSLLEAFYQSQTALAQSQYRQQIALLFPDFEASYFALQNSGIPNLQAFAIGLRLPLGAVAAHRDKKLARIAWEQSLLQADQQSFERQGQVKALEASLAFLLRQLQNSPALEAEAEQAFQQSQARFERGASDANALGQSIKAITEALIEKELLLLQAQILSAQIDYLKQAL